MLFDLFWNDFIFIINIFNYLFTLKHMQCKHTQDGYNSVLMPHVTIFQLLIVLNGYLTSLSVLLAALGGASH